MSSATVPTIYRSTDAGAPPLRGYTPGDFINLLNKCLVTGYGTQPGAGWTMPYSYTPSGTTTRAVFQPGTGNKYFLEVNDTSATANYTRFTQPTGYTQISGYDGSGNPVSNVLGFPNPAQAVIRNYTYCQGTAANARPWKLYATSQFMLMFWVTADTANLTSWQVTNNSVTTAFAFGDLLGAQPWDTFATVLMGSTYPSGPGYIAGGDSCPFMPVWPPTPTAAAAPSTTYNVNGYLARELNLLGGSIPAYVLSEYAAWGGYMGRASGNPFPNPMDGSMMLSPFKIFSNQIAQGAIRGRLPVYACPQNLQNVMQPGAFVNGTGVYAGRQFELTSNGIYAYQLLVDTTGPWS